MFIVHSYTEDDAINDGLHVRLAGNITATTNLVTTIAPDNMSETGFDLRTLWSKILPKVLAYFSGTYYDEGATDYPDECDKGLACYLIDLHKVWIMPTYPGSDRIILMLPEDY